MCGDARPLRGRARGRALTVLGFAACGFVSWGWREARLAGETFWLSLVGSHGTGAFGVQDGRDPFEPIIEGVRRAFACA
jgi:hypothetical protein